MKPMLEAGKKLRSLKGNISDILLNPKSENTTFALIMRQTISGGVATIADLVVFQLLIMLEISMYIAVLFAGLVAFGTNFTITRLYVFKNKKSSDVLSQLFKFLIVFILALLIVEVCLFVFTSYFAVSPLIAKIMSVPIVFIWTLVATRMIFIKNLRSEL